MLGFMMEVLCGTILMYLPKGNMTTTPGNLEGLGVDSIGEKDYDPSTTTQRIKKVLDKVPICMVQYCLVEQ